MTSVIRPWMLIAALVPASAAAGPLQRYALVVGANNGGGDRPRLHYAIADAERFARVMTELGGVDPVNELVLREPKVGDLLAALDHLNARIAARRAAQPAPARTEVFLYYSGHADEKGLLLGEDRLSYRTLRDRLDDVSADVRIAVLDACASGAFTRLKGGRARAPFLVDDSAAMHGHAFLTSSAETESAQESDRIRGSYFTHYLVSAFRGAADTSGDGRVTLNEAYQFAFAETLGRTVDTKGGAQHPSYDINLSGAGDVVMTDVRQTTARLVLGPELDGRIFIRTPSRSLIAELSKARGRRVEIGVEPGSYEIRVERNREALVSTAVVADGAAVVVDPARFGAAPPLESTRRRGDGDSGAGPLFAVDGRSRITLRTGVWGNHGFFNVLGRTFDVVGGLQYSMQINDRLAISAELAAFGAEKQMDIIGGLAIPIDVRWNPLRGTAAVSRWKPFVSAGLVPVTSADSESERRSTIGARVGAGIDIHRGDTLVFTIDTHYNAVPELRHPSGVFDNFNGLEFSSGIGFQFGRRR